MLIHTQIQTHVLTYLQTCTYILKYKHIQTNRCKTINMHTLCTHVHEGSRPCRHTNIMINLTPQMKLSVKIYNYKHSNTNDSTNPILFGSGPRRSYSRFTYMHVIL